MEKTKTISKRLVAIMLSLAMVFSLVQGGIFTASAETSGDFEYSVLVNNSVEITKYNGSETELTIPSKIDGKTVISIKDVAFYNCISLTSVIIPDSVWSIGNSAFAGCSSLNSISVSENNARFSSIDGVMFNKDKTELVCYPKGKNDDSYTIPDSVKSISDSAFNNCDLLTSIEIPNRVESIGNNAFRDCDILTSIEIPDSVKSIGDSAFNDCDLLTNIVIPDSVESIGQAAFYKTGLYNEKQNWKNELLYIGNYLIVADDDISGEVQVEEGTKAIADGAFTNCDKLTSVTIPNGVESIGNSAFFDCNSLTSATIGNSVKCIGNSTFFACDKLTSVTIGNGVKSIENSAFFGCDSLTSIVIPDSVKSIGDSAFNNCDLLTSVTIGNGVESIGFYAFGSCYALTSVTLGNGVKSIGYEAFILCQSLKSIVIPNSVNSIGNFAFEWCTSLKSVTIGNGVKSIGEKAFNNCFSLTTVKYLGSKEQWDKIAIAQGNDALLKAICKHSNTTTQHKKSATYFVKGYSGDTYCNTCKKVVKKGKIVAKKTLKKPTVKVTAGVKQIKVKYTKVSGATGFQVQYKKGKKTVTKNFSTKKSATKAIKKLAKGRYKVKVRALVKSGKNKAYSAWTKTKTIYIK